MTEAGNAHLAAGACVVDGELDQKLDRGCEEAIRPCLRGVLLPDGLLLAACQDDP